MIDQLGMDGLGGASVRVKAETVCPGCAKELEALRKQVVELTKDAMRYRWLRDTQEGKTIRILPRQEWDDAIDEATKGQTK